MSATVDPITIEIVTSAFRSVVDETFIALMKSAYSTNIKERHDHSTAICDRDGRLIVQAEMSLPIHIASMTGLMETLLAKYRLDEIHEGDVFVANDPHVAGGTHLPDINYAAPLFLEGELVGFICNIAHHADIGGMVPGSMAGGMSEIYQEGLRIPLVRLFRKGELQQDIMDLFLLNARIPDERRGDHFAQIAACKLGVRRVAEIGTRYSLPLIREVWDELIRRTHDRMRAAIAAVPDGVYAFEDVMDDDGLGTTNIPLKLKITATGDRVVFDLRGSAPQVRGNINLPLNATKAAVAYALRTLLDPEIANNQGIIDCCEIVADPGSIVHCQAPAPVAQRLNTSQRLVDVIIGAFAPAIPGRVVGAANGANTTAVFSGTDPRNGQPYLYFETLGGGFGGRNDRDGKDGVQVHITNTSNLPIEAIETEYPLRVISYGFIEDSGGAGQYRGGAGLRRVIQPVGHDCTFNGAGERFSNPPWGIFGAGPGGTGRFVLNGPAGEAVLEVKPSAVAVPEGSSVTVETPGSGGYGPAKERSAEAVAEDARSGKFSDGFLRRNYPAQMTAQMTARTEPA
ncbi:hydantoinase B/oxoprolinase family protein [Frigidibacter albus]|uniref:Hydantoinase B/oxoprolinase family protein n=1 Tax=Frigidibacter albus TaxID=1465486 RepID=A0A6L8VCZ0_9RHOB|nr:hydantoinase B/oxoprolinase family protein [Frigidibacter albus]MZQ87536.1 hydantoinase B/oxoprolinase family protein [Frigidibacter albus]NBE29442.1 hydantoinase B/oxoprolinase family protein [Frigidibacter albus]GGH44873.1 methylhydantoinase [Frigidibacter albus]